MKPAGKFIPADEIKEIIIPNTPAGRALARIAIRMAERRKMQRKGAA